MYGLPKDFDASFLTEKNLEMICFNANQIYLHFGSDITITIEGEFSHFANGEGGRILRVPVPHSNLMLLLEHSVSAASGDVAGTLTLVFDNGHVVKCFDSFPNYECYKIKNGDEIIIV